MTARTALLVIAMLVLGACNVAASPPASAGPSTVPDASIPAGEAASEVPSPSDAPSETPASSAVPSDELGSFTCDLPITEGATATLTTNYTDVRVGTHPGYDRVVFEFNAGTPEFTLERDEPPYEQDASGMPLEVTGESVLHLVLRGSTTMTDSGEMSYHGPLNFDPGFPMLVDVVHGGDFEAQTTWFIGLAGEACVRVLLLDDPDRIVLDVEH
jgi:hypothetical protein